MSAREDVQGLAVLHDSYFDGNYHFLICVNRACYIDKSPCRRDSHGYQNVFWVLGSRVFVPPRPRSVQRPLECSSWWHWLKGFKQSYFWSTRDRVQLVQMGDIYNTWHRTVAMITTLWTEKRESEMFPLPDHYFYSGEVTLWSASLWSWCKLSKRCQWIPLTTTEIYFYRKQFTCVRMILEIIQ